MVVIWWNFCCVVDGLGERPKEMHSNRLFLMMLKDLSSDRTSALKVFKCTPFIIQKTNLRHALDLHPCS